MLDLFSNLALGFHVVFQFVPWSPAWLGGYSIPIPANILLCLIGALVGTLVGVLPGIGPSPPSRCCCRSRSAFRRSAR